LKKNSITNFPASVHQRLLNLDPARIQDFTLILRRYAFERWLYRLGRSDHAEKFVLKGAMLFALWTEDVPRKTKDLDLLGIGDFTEGCLRRIFSQIGSLKVEPDGLVFKVDDMNVEPIRDGTELQKALGAAIKHKATNSPSALPIGLSDEFALDKAKNIQWRAFLRRIGKDPAGLSFPDL